MNAKISTQQPDTPLVPEIVVTMVQQLVDAFQPERIYLFGSYARGDTTPDSDYDLMVVVHDATLPQYRCSQEAHRVLTSFPIMQQRPYRHIVRSL